jgi:hypothetical protein
MKAFFPRLISPNSILIVDITNKNVPKMSNLANLFFGMFNGSLIKQNVVETTQTPPANTHIYCQPILTATIPAINDEITLPKGIHKVTPEIIIPSLAG